MSSDPEREEELRVLADRLGVQANNLELLDRALTHSSTSGDRQGPVRDYESLEFLGDAVLELAVSHRLFETSPERTPGEYTRMRARLVNRRSVARVARALDIAPAIRLGRGEERTGGRQRTALLADCLEALLGAIYLDRGWDAARAFAERIFEPEFERARALDDVWDFKSRLQHYCQAEHIALPRFDVVRSEGPDHLKEFEIEVIVQDEPAGRGTGSTKKEAELDAARAALKRVGVCFGEG